MTRTEVFKILAAIETMYPRNDGISIKDNAVIALWEKMIGHLPYEVAERAVMVHMAKGKFRPVVADILQNAMELTQPEIASLNPAGAWEEVKEAIRKYGFYRENDAMASMSPITAQVVRAMSWRDLCQSENQMADRAHFMKMFEAYKDREQKQALLPDGLKIGAGQRSQLSASGAIAQLTSGMAMK